MINLPFLSLVERIPPPVTTEIRDTKIISIFYVATNEITESVRIIQKKSGANRKNYNNIFIFSTAINIHSLDSYLNVQVCVILQLYDCY